MSAAPPISLPPDRALPHRDRLLDAAAVARRLAPRLGAHGPITIDACVCRRVKYRVGESLRVLYQIRSGAATYLVAARAFPVGRSDGAYRRAVAGAVTCEPLHAVLHDAELDAVFWTFPNDRKIARLPLLVRPGRTRKPRIAGPWIGSRLVAYAPEKSATAQCLSARGEVLAYAKLYAGDEGRDTAAVYAALGQAGAAAGGHLRVPRLVAYLPRWRMLLLEPVAGPRIADLNGQALLAGMRGLGAAVATLHGLPAPALPRFTRFDPQRLQQAARLVGWMRPELAGRARQLARELIGRYEPGAERPGWLHGDVHLKNGIVTPHGVSLIDFDQAALGPACADLGSMLAELRYCRCIGRYSRGDERALRAQFLAGYASVRSLPDPAVLRWNTAAALLAERALRAINRMRPEGLLHLDEVLAGAWELLIAQDARDDDGSYGRSS